MSISLNWEDPFSDPIVRAGVEELWHDRMSEGHQDWHAYGTCCFEDKERDCSKLEQKGKGPSTLVLFMQRQCDTSAWVNSVIARVRHLFDLALNNEARFAGAAPPSAIAERAQFAESENFAVSRLKDRCKVVVMGPFTRFETGVCYRPSTLLRPGARVFSTSPQIGDSPNGTIGAFLKRKHEKETDERPMYPNDEILPHSKNERVRPPKRAWLLSNKHVLLQRNQNLQSVEVRGAGQTLISRQVAFVKEEDQQNTVDAAVAQIEDPRDIEAFYDGIDVFCPCSVEPSPGMRVHKLGNATGVTSGTIICHIDKVFVGGLKGAGGHEFKDQWLIGSDDTFAANGDSGSLVIGNGHPVALLFAMADKIEGVPKDKGFIPPFGLASSISKVLNAIGDELDEAGNLEIMLHHKRKEPCPCVHLHADKEGLPPTTPNCPEQNSPTQHKEGRSGHNQHQNPQL